MADSAGGLQTADAGGTSSATSALAPAPSKPTTEGVQVQMPAIIAMLLHAPPPSIRARGQVSLEKDLVHLASVKADLNARLPLPAVVPGGLPVSLVAQGAPDVDASEGALLPAGTSPLFVALQRQDEDMVLALLAARADPSQGRLQLHTRPQPKAKAKAKASGRVGADSDSLELVTPVMFAMRNNMPSMAQAIMDAAMDYSQAVFGAGQMVGGEGEVDEESEWEEEEEEVEEGGLHQQTGA